MQKFLSLFSIILLLFITACGGSEDTSSQPTRDNTANSSNPAAENPAPENPEPETPEPKELGNISYPSITFAVGNKIYDIHPSLEDEQVEAIYSIVGSDSPSYLQINETTGIISTSGNSIQAEGTDSLTVRVTGAGDYEGSVKDISVTINKANWPAPRGDRYADEQDVADIGKFGVGISVGDYVIDTPANNGSIQRRVQWGNDFELGQGRKILIRGGVYSFAHIQMPKVNGTEESPVIMTNYFGQVEFRGGGLSIYGGSNIKITGRYVAGESGDPYYRGHDAGYAYSTGTYGFYMNAQWENISGSGVTVSGVNKTVVDDVVTKPGVAPSTNIEIEFIEIGNGYFAGISGKHDRPDEEYQEDIMYLHLHDLYIHDIHSEGMYLGFNATRADQHRFSATIENNRILRTGTEGVQIGNGYNVIIRNNVINSALSWKSPFQRFQDNAIQFNTRGGTNIIEKNIILGAGEKFFSYSYTPINGFGEDIIRDNYATGSHNYGMFFGNEDNPFTFERNFLLNKAADYGEVYVDKVLNEWVISFTSQEGKVYRDNILSSEDVFFRSHKTGVTNEGAVKFSMNSLPKPVFLDDFFGGLEDWTRLETWFATIGQSDQFPATNEFVTTRKGEAVSYNTGDIVVYHHPEPRMYVSKINNNTAEPVKETDDANWDFVEYVGNGVPCDDFRLAADNPLNTLGWGLMDNPEATLNQFEFIDGDKRILIASEAAQGQTDSQGNIIDYRLKVIEN